MKSVILLGTIILFGGACVTSRQVQLDIKGDPEGGYVDVDEITRCPKMPCTISLECRHSARNEFKAKPKTSTYRIVAYPPKIKGVALYSQSRTIEACKLDSGSPATIMINFELDTVKPMDRIEIRSH